MSPDALGTASLTVLLIVTIRLSYHHVDDEIELTEN